MINKIYDIFEESFACVFFMLIFLLMVVGVILRYVFGISFAWNIELARYSFVWLTFIGASYVRRDNGHIKIELFSGYLKKKLSPRGRLIFWVGTKAVIIVYLGFLIYFSYMLSIRSWRFKSQAMQISQSFLYMSVGLGALMYIGREIIDSVKIFKKGDFQ